MHRLHWWLHFLGYSHCIWNPTNNAQHGTALISKIAPSLKTFSFATLASTDPETVALDKRIAAEGRVITCEFDQFVMVGGYTPTLTETNHPRYQSALKKRDRWHVLADHHLDEVKKLNKPCFFLGDFNACLSDRDAKLTRSTGPDFPSTTKHEQQALKHIMSKHGLLDAATAVGTFKRGEQYTWARNKRHKETNVQLRLDYILFSDTMLSPTSTPWVTSYRNYYHQEGSDHTPIAVSIQTDTESGPNLAELFNTMQGQEIDAIPSLPESPDALNLVMGHIPKDHPLLTPYLGRDTRTAITATGMTLQDDPRYLWNDRKTWRGQTHTVVTHPPEHQASHVLRTLVGINTPWACLVPLRTLTRDLFHDNQLQIHIIETKIARSPGSAFLRYAWVTQGLHLPSDISFTRLRNQPTPTTCSTQLDEIRTLASVAKAQAIESETKTKYNPWIQTQLEADQRAVQALHEIDNAHNLSDCCDLDADGLPIPGTFSMSTVLPNWADSIETTDDDDTAPIRATEPSTCLSSLTASTSDRRNNTTIEIPDKGFETGRFVPLVEATVNGQTTKALVDTGADNCIASAPYLKRVLGTDRLNIKTIRNAPRFVIGNNSVISPTGKVKFKARMGKYIFTIHAYVFENAPFDIILGSQFLKSNKIDVLNTKNGLAIAGHAEHIPFIGHTARPQCHKLTVANLYWEGNDFWLAPRTERLGWCSALDSEFNPIDNDTHGIITSNHDRPLPNALLANGTTQIVNGKTRVLLANLTHKSTLIKRGTCLGTFTQCLEEDYKVIAWEDNSRPQLQSLLDDLKSSQNTLCPITESDAVTDVNCKEPGEPEHNSTSTVEQQRVDAELPATYLDQLLRDHPLGPDGLPQDLDLSNCELNPEELEELKAFLRKYCSAFSRGVPGTVKGYKFPIDTGNAAPQRARGQRFPPGPARSEIIKQLTHLKKLGIVQEAQSPWAANLLLVPQKGGKIRMCVNLKKLNNVTKDIAYDLPHQQDVLEGLAGSDMFSSIDCESGYYHIPIREEDREKTAFNSPIGQLQFTRMMFGAKAAPSYWSYMINDILGDRPAFMQSSRKGSSSSKITLVPRLNFNVCQVYMDDICVHSKGGFTAHLKALQQVLDRISAAGLKLKPKKCQFCTTSFEFLGRRVTTNGIQPSPSKLKQMEQMQDFPKTRKALKAALGFFSYFRMFIKNFAAISKPLNDLLKKGVAYPPTPSPECKLAYDTLRTHLSPNSILAFPDWTDEFTLETDASSKGISCLLRNSKSKRVIQFASRALKDHETRYHQAELEALAVVYGVSVFRSYLLGRRFTIITDNSSVQQVFSQAHPPKTQGRIDRWLLRLAEYNYDIVHRGKDHNIPCDYLSRYPQTNSPDPAIEPLYAAVIADTLNLRAIPLSANDHLQTGSIVRDLFAFTRSMANRRNNTANTPPDENTDSTKNRATQGDIHNDDAATAGTTINDTLQSKAKQLASTDMQTENIFNDMAGLFRRHYEKDEECQRILLRIRNQAKGIVSNATKTADCYTLNQDGLITLRENFNPNIHATGDKEIYFVPKALRQSVLYSFHGLPALAHLGLDKTYPLLSSRFYWPGIKLSLKKWIKSCLVCARRKWSRPSRQGMTCKMPQYPHCFHTVHYDLVGPLEETVNGNKYLLTAVDPFSGYPIAVPIPNKTAVTVAKALLEHVIWVHGLPEVMVSDRDPSFCSEVVQTIKRELGIKHLKTSGWQPQSNGKVERWHRFLNTQATIWANEYKKTWDTAIGPLLFTYRISVNAVTKYSPFHLVYGREPRSVFDTLMNSSKPCVSHDSYIRSVTEHIRTAFKHVTKRQYRSREINRLCRDKHDKRLHVTFEVGDPVLVWGPVTAKATHKTTSKLLYKWSNPHVISKRVSPVLYRTLRYSVNSKGEGKLVESDPINVNRLAHYTPFQDDRPSVPCNPDRPVRAWRKPDSPPAPGDIIVIPVDSDWEELPFALGKVLVVIPAEDTEPERYVVQWYGHFRQRLKGPFLPGWVDTKDNKVVYTTNPTPRLKTYTSKMTKTIIRKEYVALVNPQMTKAGRITETTLDLIDDCPLIPWTRPPMDDASILLR